MDMRISISVPTGHEPVCNVSDLAAAATEKADAIMSLGDGWQHSDGPAATLEQQANSRK